MKATLIKINGIYNLLQNDRMIASDDADFQVDYNIAKLSLKNCEAIANGYDLDELVKNMGTEFYVHGNYDFENGVKEGFLKALEILGDKKFSEEDIQNFIDSENPGQYPYIALQLKQKSNEFDVEVEMEEDCPFDYTSRCTQGRCDCNKPKRDKDGCLILKRK
jgi:hypothetical protein